MTTKKDPMTLLSLTPEERELLKRLAATEGTSMTEIVRRALSYYQVMMSKAGNEN